MYCLSVFKTTTALFCWVLPNSGDRVDVDVAKKLPVDY